MAVFELKAGIHGDEVPRAGEFLSEHEALDFMVLEDKPSGRACLVGYFQSREQAKGAWTRLMAGSEWQRLQPNLRELPDEDWKNSYRAHFRAWRFGRLNWVPVWERTTFLPQAGDEVLWLDPGMAFGTGNHETTRLVVERLVESMARRGADMRVVDAGCGSGILALSAAKLGSRAVTGFDSDPEAIRVSEGNALLNAMQGAVEFRLGDLQTGWKNRQADLIMANIQADVLVRFARELCGAVAPGGELILSGILDRELADVRTCFALAAHGWKLDSRTLGEWADLVASRPS